MYNAICQVHLRGVLVLLFSIAELPSNIGCDPSANSAPLTPRSLESAATGLDRGDLGPGQRTPIYDENTGNLVLVCQTSNCGGNSPVVNRFPINGFNPSGYFNSQGIRLKLRSIRARNSCNGATLNVDGSTGQLIGEGQGACRHADLVGATFQIEIKRDRTTISRTILIDAAGELNRGENIIPGYKFAWFNDQYRVSLCDDHSARKLYEGTGLYNKFKFWKRSNNDDVYLNALTTFATTSTALESKDYSRYVNTKKGGITSDVIRAEDMAIVFPGEVRGENGAIIGGSIKAGWFNIACSRDALARADIYQIEPHLADPNERPNYDDRRKTALMMLTANYCDKSRYTFENNEIEWERKSPSGSMWEPSDGQTTGRVREAVWGPDGAICLDNSRLYHHKPVVSIPDWHFPPGCPKKICQNQDQFLTALHQVCPAIQNTCDPAVAKDMGYFRSYSTGN